MGGLCSKSKAVPPSNNESLSSRQYSTQSNQSSVVAFAASPSGPVKSISRSKATALNSSNSVEMRVSNSAPVNPMHNVEAPQIRNLQPEEKVALNYTSMIICPPSEHLLKRLWIRKRGHMVRTWKKRYCVLEKNELKYYSKPDPSPPFGKGKKGHIALMGAVMNIVSSENDNTICVEIYGNLGEKDLFFELDYTIEAQEWLRVLRWAMRKNTLTTLVQNLKSKSGVGDVDLKDKGAKYTSCVDWQENELKTYNLAVENLRECSRVVRVLMYDKRGVRSVRLCSLSLWTSFDASTAPIESTDISTLGLAWAPLSGVGSGDKGLRTIALSDLEDIIVYDHCELNNGDNMRWFDEHGAVTSNSSKHSHCAGKPSRIISFITRYGHTLDVVGCCVHDYDNCLTSLCELLLFQNMRRKLKAAVPNARTTVQATTANTSAVCGACQSIHHTPL